MGDSFIGDTGGGVSSRGRNGLIRTGSVWFLQIHFENIQTESFTAGENLTGPISII